MEFVELTGDCTDFVVQPNTFHLIPHNLNTDGVWGSGVVVPIFTKWEVAARAYEDWWEDDTQNNYSPKCLSISNRDFQLGNIQVVNVAKGILVVNMLAQKSMGSQFGMPPGRYEALQECLLKIRVCCDKINNIGKNVVIESPKFGAVRSGLSWNTIFKMVEDIFEHTEGTWNTYTYEGPHA
jgi:hypothetical protein